MQKIKSLTDEYNYYGLNKHLAPDETPEDAEGFFFAVNKEVNTCLIFFPFAFKVTLPPGILVIVPMGLVTMKLSLKYTFSAL